MSDMFAGLESLGLKPVNVDLYEGEEALMSEEEKESMQKPKQSDEEIEAEVLFDKKVSCPCCYTEFTSKTVRTGKIKPLGVDSDLRPKYQVVDPLKYDAIACPTCGYAALSRFFPYVTGTQAKWIREQITNTFTGIDTKGEIYSYDDAIMRHKLALLNVVIKKGKNSEKAYTCLKLSWLCRGKREQLEAEGSVDEKELEALIKEENEYIKNAYDGFIVAYSKESFPMCGMDATTTMYLLAELARRTGDYDSAGVWVSRVLTSREAKDRIKQRALDLKELIKKAKK